MNSGLYALAGASATATAAAWANRLLEPMTKVSNRYCGLSRVGSLSRGRRARGRCPGRPAAAGAARARRRRPATASRSSGAASRVGGSAASAGTASAGPPRSRLGSTTTAIRSSRARAARTGPTVITWRSRASITSLANWCGTDTRAVSPTTPSSRLSRMKARCCWVTVSSSTPSARSQTWRPVTVLELAGTRRGLRWSRRSRGGPSRGARGAHRVGRHGPEPCGGDCVPSIVPSMVPAVRAGSRERCPDRRPHGRPQPVYIGCPGPSGSVPPDLGRGASAAARRRVRRCRPAGRRPATRETLTTPAAASKRLSTTRSDIFRPVDAASDQARACRAGARAADLGR